MADEENPDIYICALLTQMVTAREGDVRREFQAVVEALNRLRGHDEKMFAGICVALGVSVNAGQVEISR